MSKPSAKPRAPRSATPAPERLALHLRSKEEFITAVDQIATAQLTLAGLKAKRDSELAAINAIHGPAIKIEEDKIKLHLKATAAYADAFTAEVLPEKDRLSYETALATYGLRLDPPSIETLKKITEADAIALIERDIEKQKLHIAWLETEHPTEADRIAAAYGVLARLESALRQVTQLNKEVLHTFSDEELAQYGLYRAQDRKFWVKGKEESGTRTTTPADPTAN